MPCEYLKATWSAPNILSLSCICTKHFHSQRVLLRVHELYKVIHLISLDFSCTSEFYEPSLVTLHWSDQTISSVLCTWVFAWYFASPFLDIYMKWPWYLKDCIHSHEYDIKCYLLLQLPLTKSCKYSIYTQLYNRIKVQLKYSMGISGLENITMIWP